MFNQLVKRKLLMFLQEDIPYLDVTALAVPDRVVKAVITAKQPGIIAGTSILAILFEMSGIEAGFKVRDGDEVASSEIIVELEGSSRAILQVERLSLNILGKMSGIATVTRELVKKAKTVNPAIIIAATRKTTPGFRLFEKIAVTAGGGDTHRFSLSDVLLLKDNHLSLFVDITAALQSAKETGSVYKKIEVEVKNRDEAIEAARAGADIIMLDNFSPVEIKTTLKHLKAERTGNLLIEASGNISPENIGEYAVTGVDVISCGFITHSAASLDVSMNFLPE